jgi:hypothetical protein
MVLKIFFFVREKGRETIGDKRIKGFSTNRGVFLAIDIQAIFDKYVRYVRALYTRDNARAMFSTNQTVLIFDKSGSFLFRIIPPPTPSLVEKGNRHPITRTGWREDKNISSFPSS